MLPLHVHSKCAIYKTLIRTIITYLAETRPKTAEMKIVYKISGKTFLDSVRIGKLGKFAELKTLMKV